MTSAALFRSTLALGGLLFGVTVASSEVREHLCVASDIEEEAVVLPEPEATDPPAPAPEAAPPAPAVTASSGALAALAPLLATDDARFAAASCRRPRERPGPDRRIPRRDGLRRRLRITCRKILKRRGLRDRAYSREGRGRRAHP